MDVHSAESLAKQVFDYPKPRTTREALAALNERAGPAEKLAEMAFKDRDKTAWSLLQRGIFGLPIFKVTSGQQADDYRPFFRGDLVASGLRDIIWEAEERHLDWQKPPKSGMTGEELAAFAEADFRKRTVANHPLFKYLATVELNDSQLRAAVLAYLHSVMVRIRTVHRSIMIVLLPLEFRDCVNASPLLVGELGEGKLAGAHAWKTAMDIERWGDKVDWHAPVESVEMMAMLNWNLRTVTHPRTIWAFTGLFCVEWNSYLELRQAMLVLRERGIKDEMMEVLILHGEGAPYDRDRHAHLVREQLGTYVKSDEDAAIVLTAIARHQSLYHGFFDVELEKMKARIEKA